MARAIPLTPQNVNDRRFGIPGSVKPVEEVRRPGAAALPVTTEMTEDIASARRLAENVFTDPAAARALQQSHPQAATKSFLRIVDLLADDSIRAAVAARDAIGFIKAIPNLTTMARQTQPPPSAGFSIPVVTGCDTLVWIIIDCMAAPLSRGSGVADLASVLGGSDFGRAVAEELSNVAAARE